MQMPLLKTDGPSAGFRITDPSEPDHFLVGRSGIEPLTSCLSISGACALCLPGKTLLKDERKQQSYALSSTLPSGFPQRLDWIVMSRRASAAGEKATQVSTASLHESAPA